jgi:hypothetical protein
VECRCCHHRMPCSRSGSPPTEADVELLRCRFRLRSISPRETISAHPAPPRGEEEMPVSEIRATLVSGVRRLGSEEPPATEPSHQHTVSRRVDAQTTVPEGSTADYVRTAARCDATRHVPTSGSEEPAVEACELRRGTSPPRGRSRGPEGSRNNRSPHSTIRSWFERRLNVPRRDRQNLASDGPGWRRHVTTPPKKWGRGGASEPDDHSTSAAPKDG